jgi:hypothetical protein
MWPGFIPTMFIERYFLPDRTERRAKRPVPIPSAHFEKFEAASSGETAAAPNRTGRATPRGRTLREPPWRETLARRNTSCMGLGRMACSTSSRSRALQSLLAAPPETAVLDDNKGVRAKI